MTFSDFNLSTKLARELVATIGKARALLWVDILRKAVEQQKEMEK